MSAGWFEFCNNSATTSTGAFAENKGICAFLAMLRSAAPFAVQLIFVTSMAGNGLRGIELGLKR
jgi:hypothetical protein